MTVAATHEGEEALDVARAYVKLRYRLMPLLYGAARRAYDEGVPPIRKLSMDHPDVPEADRSDQFLLGDDLLVAPVAESVNEPDNVDDPYLPEGGFLREVFGNLQLEGDPVNRGMDECIWLNASNSAANKNSWGHELSMRWTGRVAVPEDGWYRLFVRGNGRKTLSIEGENHPLLMALFDKGYNEVTFFLKRNEPRVVTVTYANFGSVVTACRFGIRRIKPWTELEATPRDVWLPAGQWQDLWSGREYTGPLAIRRQARPDQMPLFARVGSIIPLGPDLLHTGASGWDPITLDIRPPAAAGDAVAYELYEDDGESLGYRAGACRRTPIRVTRDADAIEIDIGPGEGAYPGALEARTWIARLHLAAGEAVDCVTCDGGRIEARAGIDRAPTWKLIEPALSAEAYGMPLRGPNAAPAPEAGPVAQLTLPRLATTQTTASIVVRLSRHAERKN